MDFTAAYGSNRAAMVDFNGTVSSSPTYFFGTHTRCEHEEFSVQTKAGPLEVIDNVDLAPRVPVQPGDRIEVRGEMVHDAGKAPIVHWTHHDPEHKHPDGFIRLRGQVYA
ncbi:MAG TPA: DUF3465 domain-containing protein [Candidatus Baltobacteraceae bacterium]|jgi:hypothetical protein|nr:DUF3465 domain-containing protein [Candidatus Baltobacteraceae bacterium]